MSATLAPTRGLVLADALPNTRLIHNVRVRDAVLVLAGALLVALFAQIAIDVPPSPVPVTGQTLAVMLVGSALGSRRGVASLMLYVLMGLALPVYAEGNQGWDVIWGASGGYLIGFIIAAYVIGRFAEMGADRKPLLAFAAFVAGQLIIFGIGVPWLKVSADLSWADAIHYGFTVFIVGGIVKAIIGAVALPSAWHLVRRADGKK